MKKTKSRQEAKYRKDWVKEYKYAQPVIDHSEDYVFLIFCAILLVVMGIIAWSWIAVEIINWVKLNT